MTRAGQALVLNVAITSADSAKAARLANAVADAYVVDKLDARFEAAKRASAWLSDRLVELGKQLREFGRGGGPLPRRQQSRRSRRSVEHDAQPGAARSVQRSPGRGARRDRGEEGPVRPSHSGAGAPAASSPTCPTSGTAGAIPDLRRQENDLKRQEADLLARYSDRHPSVVNVRAQLADVRRSMVAEAGRLAADVKHDYDLALARQRAVEKALFDVTGQTDLDAAKAISLRELERNAVVNKTLFEEFLQRAKIAEEQSTFEARDARIITPAQPPTSPSSPRSALITLASLTLGLIAGVAGGYLIELLNAGFTTPRQVEEMLDLPLLASISRMETRDLTAAGGVMTMPEYPIVKPLSRFSEVVPFAAQRRADERRRQSAESAWRSPRRSRAKASRRSP